jgi:hypothetical protein
MIVQFCVRSLPFIGLRGTASKNSVSTVGFEMTGVQAHSLQKAASP